MAVQARHRIESSLAEGLQADFTLDVVGNISAIAGAGGAPINGYSYDDLYRLTSESAPALSLAHAYDATGNRTAETVAGATTVYAYPPDSHRLTNIGGTERTFDAAGNLKILNHGNRSSPEYAYDDRNRLAAYRVGSQDVATYAHNARGERVHKSAPKAGSATLFVYAEGGQLLGEYDGDGSVLQEYAWLDALPVAVLKKGGPYPLEPDHLGTPRRAIAAELDRAVWAWDLQGPAFGTHAANDDPDADGQPFPLNLRFPGQYLDAESGLHYNYFRDYDPATGRYVESDPIGLEGGVSTFGYVNQNPMGASDQHGLIGAHDDMCFGVSSAQCNYAPPKPAPVCDSSCQQSYGSCVERCVFSSIPAVVGLLSGVGAGVSGGVAASSGFSGATATAAAGAAGAIGGVGAAFVGGWSIGCTIACAIDACAY